MRQIADNARDYGHKELDFIVIGDRKTPSSVADFCARIRHDFYPAEYLDLDAQSRFLAPKLQVLLKHLCFNLRQRRNVGIFCAWQNGADIVLSLDPHIQIGQEDFLSPHTQTGKTLSLVTRSSPTGWHNIAEDQVEAKSQPFFLRGFRQWQRGNLAPSFRATELVSVATHSRFLLGASDLDGQRASITRSPRWRAGLLPALPSPVAHPLIGTNYHECFGQIAAALPGVWPETPRACGVEIEGRKQFLAGLDIWNEIFDAERASGIAKLFNRIAAESPTPTPILPALETLLGQNT